MPEEHPTHLLAALESLGGSIAEAMGRLVRTNAEGLRGSQGRILSLIDERGTRPSALVEGSGITKQAIGQRIRELEERGWVTVEPDPSDGRAVLVRRTPAGDRVRAAIDEGIRAMEAEFAERVGPRRYATFRQVIDELGA